MYATRFGEHLPIPEVLSPHFSPEGGDQKKARMRLRASMRDRSRHFSTFRSGLFIGLSLPALISGIYESKLTFLHTDELPTPSRLSRPHQGCHSCVVGVTASEYQVKMLVEFPLTHGARLTWRYLFRWYLGSFLH